MFMKKSITVIAVLLVTVLGCTQRGKHKLTIAVAANMQYAIQALIDEFHKTDNTEINVALGASGSLTQQIMQGAPFDIFISADENFPQKLYEEHYTLEPPKTYAQGVLVIWSAKENIHPAKDLQLLANNDIKSIAIANPKTAPYGNAAQLILKKYGLYDKVASKLITGESITQTSNFIAAQAADIGFTAKAIVISDAMKNKGNWAELNTQDYPPIRQAAALLKHSETYNAAEAKKFYDFLYSQQAKDIYEKFGYIVQ